MICDEFARVDDQRIPFVDHATGSLAAAYGVERVFAFDRRLRVR
ncbi:hypothetical protein [Natronorubrum sp. FCH18a]